MGKKSPKQPVPKQASPKKAPISALDELAEDDGPEQACLVRSLTVPAGFKSPTMAGGGQCLKRDDDGTDTDELTQLHKEAVDEYKQVPLSPQPMKITLTRDLKPQESVMPDFDMPPSRSQTCPGVYTGADGEDDGKEDDAAMATLMARVQSIAPGEPASTAGGQPPILEREESNSSRRAKKKGGKRNSDSRCASFNDMQAGSWYGATPVGSFTYPNDQLLAFPSTYNDYEQSDPMSEMPMPFPHGLPPMMPPMFGGPPGFPMDPMLGGFPAMFPGFNPWTPMGAGFPPSFPPPDPDFQNMIDLNAKAEGKAAKSPKVKVENNTGSQRAAGGKAESISTKLKARNNANEKKVADGTAPAQFNECGTAVEDADRTTVMMKDIPIDYTRSQFLDVLNYKGFKGLYNLMYLPKNFSTMEGIGYAFVNFVRNEDAVAAMEALKDFKQWSIKGYKGVCDTEMKTSWATPLQGYKAHVNRYRDSPVMHPTTDDEFKPMLFGADGEETKFDPPTKKIRAPRKKPSKRKDADGDGATEPGADADGADAEDEQACRMMQAGISC